MPYKDRKAQLDAQMRHYHKHKARYLELQRKRRKQKGYSRRNEWTRERICTKGARRAVRVLEWIKWGEAREDNENRE